MSVRIKPSKSFKDYKSKTKMFLKLNSSENHFEAVMDNQNIAKWLYIVFSFLVILFASPFYFGIIWYERFGHGNKQTLMNKLGSFFCMVIIAYIFVVIPGDICIALRSINPPWYCDLQNLLKSVTLAVLLLIFDSILLVKFVLIFYLKNPSITHDGFWNLFVKIWITVFVFISQLVHFFFPGKKTLNYLMCIREVPSSVDNLKYKTRWFTIALITFSIFLYTVIYIKIKLFMKKVKTTQAQSSSQIMCFKKNMFENKKALLTVITPIIAILLLLLLSMQIEPLRMNIFPNYYICWILQSAPLVFISIYLAIFYSGEGQMKKILIRKTKELFQQYELTNDWLILSA